jgi:hypothetical protein
VIDVAALQLGAVIEPTTAHTVALLAAIAGVATQNWRNRLASKDELGKAKDLIANTMAKQGKKISSLDANLRNHITNTPTGEMVNRRINVANRELRDEVTAVTLDRDAKVDGLERRTRQLERNCHKNHDSDVNGEGA